MDLSSSYLGRLLAYLSLFLTVLPLSASSLPTLAPPGKITIPVFGGATPIHGKGISYVDRIARYIADLQEHRGAIWDDVRNQLLGCC